MTTKTEKQNQVALGSTAKAHAQGSTPVAAWQPIATAPENIVVLTKIDDGHGVRNEQPLKRRGRLWWLEEGSMYVYYTPTHWRPTAPPEQP